MPEQKLNLFQFSSGEMAQARAAAAEVMGSEVRDSSAQCCSLHNMPNGFGRDVVPPDRAGSADSAKDEAGLYPGSLCPVIYRALDPARHRNRSDVFAFPDQVGYNPVFLSDLKVVSLQSDQLGAPETASDENRQNCSIPLPPQSIRTWCAQERSALIGRQPVADPGSQPFGALHPSNTCRQLGAQEAGIRSLIGKPPHSGESDVDRRRSEILLFQEEPVSKYRMRQRNYRVDRGGSLDYRRAAAQAVGVSSASR